MISGVMMLKAEVQIGEKKSGRMTKWPKTANSTKISKITKKVQIH
jgi:hypothetical protein